MFRCVAVLFTIYIYIIIIIYTPRANSPANVKHINVNMAWQMIIPFFNMLCMILIEYSISFTGLVKNVCFGCNFLTYVIMYSKCVLLNNMLKFAFKQKKIVFS